mmetsp:Transcript_42553/g.96819  ORF Transcript_42553/g.96819 Transcript_42553/m.96819 type:complete len:449 (+) Transcript_42553:230-1576(+)
MEVSLQTGTTNPVSLFDPAEELQKQVAVALEYLNEVRTRFASDPTVYAQFLEMVKELKSEVIDTPTAIQKVTALFAGHFDLIQGFNTFLPREHQQGGAQHAARTAEEEEEGWRMVGSLLIGVRVRGEIPPVGTMPQLTENATVWGWLPAGESNFNEESGLPAALWRVRFDNAFGEEDLEESEVHECAALYKRWDADELHRLFSNVVEASHDAEDGLEQHDDGEWHIEEGFDIQMYLKVRDVYGDVDEESDDEESQFQRETMGKVDPDYETEAFHDTLVRFVAPLKPEGIPDHVMVVSTSAAPNGKFFTIRDITDGIGTSLNLELDGYPTGAFDGQGWLGGIQYLIPGPEVTVWDLTPPARDPVLATVMRRAKAFAFAMGLHPRLGAQAGMRVLDTEILCMICKFASKGVMAEEMGAEAAAAMARDPVLTAEAEDIRARIPIFNTQWVS